MVSCESVVNSQGQVIGVVTSTAAILPFISTTSSLLQNINWAAKSDYAKLLFNSPEQLPDANNREAEIERVSRALGSIEATQ